MVIGALQTQSRRQDMASGVSGTMPFTGLVVGIAGLGVVLYGRVAAVIAAALPDVPAVDRQALVQAVTAGHLSGAAVPGHEPVAVAALALASFAEGYRWLFLGRPVHGAGHPGDMASGACGRDPAAPVGRSAQAVR